MGRTVPSYRQALEREIDRWKGFRKALRSRDAEAFDRMMNACRLFASAASMATRPILLEAMFMSILLNQEKALTEIKDKLDILENKLNHPCARSFSIWVLSFWVEGLLHILDRILILKEYDFCILDKSRVLLALEVGLVVVA